MEVCRHRCDARLLSMVPSGFHVFEIMTSNTSKYIIKFLATLVMPESIKKLGPVDLTISQRDNSTGWSNECKHMLTKSDEKSGLHCLALEPCWRASAPWECSPAAARRHFVVVFPQLVSAVSISARRKSKWSRTLV